MIPLPREIVKRYQPVGFLPPKHYPWSSPFQVPLARSPWHVAVASMLLCRTRRIQAQPAFLKLMGAASCPETLCRLDVSTVEDCVRGCGLHRNRSRQLQRMSTVWLSDSWEDLRDLPGVGVYVADAVGLFCFGCTDLESADGVLNEYARTLAGQTQMRDAEAHGERADGPLLGGPVP